jgi:Phosphotransferase enzyme family
VRTRPWSALVRVPTADGDVWFKEAAPSLAFEPALTELLAHRRPDCVPQVLAAEGARMLTADAGTQLRELISTGGPAPSWEEIVGLYAELQIELADSVDGLLAMGAPDSRPGTLGRRLGGPVPLTLIHEEVHDGNVFVRDRRPVFIDWAEASVSHPFAGMINTLRRAVDVLGCEPGSPPILAIRDAYLEPWTCYAPLDELRDLFTAGYAFGAIVRAATWERVILPLPAEAREDYEHNIGAWREIYDEAVREPTALGA